MTKITRRVLSGKRNVVSVAKPRRSILEKAIGGMERRALIAGSTVRKVVTRSKSVSLNEGVNAILNTLTSSVTDVHILALMIIALLVGYSATNNPNDDLIHKIAKALKENSLLKPLGEWMETHAKQLVGVFVMMPGAYSAPSDMRYAVMGGAAIYAWMSPDHKVMTWAIIGLALRLWFKTNNRSGKMLLALFLLGAFMYNENLPKDQKFEFLPASSNSTNGPGTGVGGSNNGTSDANPSPDMQKFCTDNCGTLKGDCSNCCLSPTKACVGALATNNNMTVSAICTQISYDSAANTKCNSL